MVLQISPDSAVPFWLPFPIHHRQFLLSYRMLWVIKVLYWLHTISSTYSINPSLNWQISKLTNESPTVGKVFAGYDNWPINWHWRKYAKGNSREWYHKQCLPEWSLWDRPHIWILFFFIVVRILNGWSILLTKF